MFDYFSNREENSRFVGANYEKYAERKYDKNMKRGDKRRGIGLVRKKRGTISFQWNDGRSWTGF